MNKFSPGDRLRIIGNQLNPFARRRSDMLDLSEPWTLCGTTFTVANAIDPDGENPFVITKEWGPPVEIRESECELA